VLTLALVFFNRTRPFQDLASKGAKDYGGALNETRPNGKRTVILGGGFWGGDPEAGGI
jgi:hypothetical protein